MVTEKEASKIKPEDLNLFERMQYTHFIKQSSHAEVLQLLINNVEGDETQLSPKLARLARRQEKLKQIRGMKTTLPKEITTQEQAEQFLADLQCNGEDFHPEDNAHSVKWITAKPSFEEREQLNKLMKDICNNVPDFDPCQYLLELEQEDNRINKLSRPTEY